MQSLPRKEDGTLVPVRYIDKKRIHSWLNVNRLQLPLHNLDLDSNTIIRNSAEKSIGKTILLLKMALHIAEHIFKILMVNIMRLLYQLVTMELLLQCTI